MANPARERELTTKDDVPLRDILGYAFELIETYNDAPRGFVDVVATEVDSRTFMTRTGDMQWREVAEMEHARTGELDTHQMAFSVKSYNHSLAYSREHIEDRGSTQFREDFQAMVEAAQDKQFEIVFDAMKNGVADGTQLWYTPDDYGAYTFSDTHDHTYADTDELFDDDGIDDTAYDPSDHIREANKDLRHHGKTPDITLMSSDLAAGFVKELTQDAQYHIPEAEGMRSTALPDQTLVVDGSRLLQTAWLSGDTFYTVASSENPVKTHTVRPVELTQSSGAPVSNNSVGEADPASLIGAYGSMRMGAKVVDPLAMVKVTATQLTTR